MSSSGNVLFINFCLSMNGTASLLLRFSKELKALNYKIFYLKKINVSEESIPCYQELKQADVFFLDFPAFRGYSDLNMDIVFCPTLDGLVCAGWLKKKFFKNAKIIAGIYHPRQMLETGYSHYLSKYIFTNMDQKSIFFMNEYTRISNEKIMQLNFKNSPILPVPIDVRPYCIRSNVFRNKIVSVGRLVSFKKYVFHVISAIEALNKKRIYFSYDIYGEGSLYEEVHECIKQKGLEKQVNLKGEVPFSRLDEVLLTAGVFIGQGTALLHASSLGVPSIIGIDSDAMNEPYSHGFLYEQSGYEVGEYMAEKKVIAYEEILENFYYLSTEEYEKISKLTYKKAAEFSLSQTVQTFLSCVEKIPVKSSVKISFFQVLFYYLTQHLKIRRYIGKGMEK